MPYEEFYDWSDGNAVNSLNEFEKKNVILKLWYGAVNIDDRIHSTILVHYVPRKNEEDENE